MFQRSRVEPDTSEAEKIIVEAREAEVRNRERSQHIEVVAARLDSRLQKNHFSESLAAAWARKGEALG